MERSVNDDSFETSRKIPLRIICNYRSSRYVCWKTTCSICFKESNGLHIIPRSACEDIFIQQGVLVPDWVKRCISHLKDNHLQTEHEVETSQLGEVS